MTPGDDLEASFQEDLRTIVQNYRLIARLQDDIAVYQGSLAYAAQDEDAEKRHRRAAKQAGVARAAALKLAESWDRRFAPYLTDSV